MGFAWIVAFLMICGSANAQVLPNSETSQLATDIRREIEIIEEKTGSDIVEYLKSISNLPLTPHEIGDSTRSSSIEAAAASTVRAVDYGFLVKNNDGEVIDFFGPQAPIDQAALARGFVEIPGYDKPDGATITRVGVREFSEAATNLSRKIVEEARANPVSAGLQEVSEQAFLATTQVAATLCPRGYYPTEMKLYMTAGFNFVVVDAGTGSELNLVMINVCQDFLAYLEKQAATLE